ncbi:CHAD domain-containing protein [Martelella endophytica]|uniref:CHAD domain-containing protein n=1 Tax=Martelella endophytica TaxID=1486262 RepID=A0A0D5LL63_MAREN|nr:CHAD domain-containing protein [Martelella endophytica]AJY44710.1 hypothetical protein TM49_01875 [Martelella endophytica]
MPFALDPDKPFDEAVEAVAVSQLEDAIELLKKKPKGLYEAIHDARKKFKRVRGLYRLVRPAAKDFAKAENARIRDLAGALSAGRDATALIECVDYLRESVQTGKADMALARLEAGLIARRAASELSEAELKSHVKDAIGGCRDAIEAVKKFDFADGAKAAGHCIEKAWKRELAHAQVALMTAQAEGEDENFHELRKKSQTYWMFTALASAAWPSALKSKRTEAKALADLLGHEHDLSVLIALLDGPDAPDIGADILTACRVLAARKRKELRKRAIKAARKVFGDEAEEEAEILGTLWRKRMKG